MTLSVIKQRLSLWNILFFLFGLAVLFFLLKQIDFRNLLDLILKIKLPFLLLGGGLYLCKGLLRALRITRANQRYPIPFLKMLRLTFASSLASQVLPLKLGELTYVYLLKRDNRASISHGLSSLMVIRLIDLLAVSLLFIIFTFAVTVPDNLAIYFRSILGFMALLFIAILFVILISARDEAIIQFLQRFSLVEKIRLLKKGVEWLAHFLFDLKQYRWNQYLEWTLLACAEWLVNFSVFHVLLFGLGMTPAWFDTVVSVTFSVLASVLPINSFGNFGTQEAGWSTGLVLLGYTRESAIASGFATHLITLAYFLVFGGISWLSYFILPEKQAK
jgi:glycosyltransferase 2 family protein